MNERVPRPKVLINSVLPAHEMGICSRVREARLALGLSQQEFSRQVGIKRERLASYEDGRAPLKVILALRMCSQFIISERWLATGAGFLGENKFKIVPFSQPMARMCMSLFEDIAAKDLNPNMSFSIAYKETLEARWHYWEAVGGLFPRVEYSASDDIGRLQNLLQFLTTSLIGFGAENEWRKKRLLFGLIRAGRILANEIARNARSGNEDQTQIERILAKLEKQVTLDNLHADKDTTFVKAKIRSLPDLLKAVSERVSLRGRKTALARELEVSRQAVDQWLSGDAKPSAELTFKLLNWVEKQER